MTRGIGPTICVPSSSWPVNATTSGRASASGSRSTWRRVFPTDGVAMSGGGMHPTHQRGPTEMRSVEQHLAHVLARIRPLPPFEQHLLDAHGHRLAEDVIAPGDVPPFDNSAMDGYAVRR